MKRKGPSQLQPVYRALAVRVEMIRLAVGMTQEELAKRVGLNRTSIVNFENGKQRIMLHDIEKFAQGLNVTPKHLLKGIWT